MDKDFDVWNTQKKETHSSKNLKDFYEREVWWIKIGVNVGIEIDGKDKLSIRPAVIVRKFNPEMALVIPTTGKSKAGKYYLGVTGEDGRAYKACLSQIRVISTKRLFRKIGMIKQDAYIELVKKLAQMMYGVL